MHLVPAEYCDFHSVAPHSSTVIVSRSEFTLPFWNHQSYRFEKVITVLHSQASLCFLKQAIFLKLWDWKDSEDGQEKKAIRRSQFSSLRERHKAEERFLT